MNIDKIYVINLKTPENVIWQKLKDLNIRPTQCTVMRAQNGWDIFDGKIEADVKWKMADWWKLKESEMSFYNRDVTPGELGCALSHYLCAKDAFENGYNNCVILEEDFVSKKKWPSDWEFKQVPDDWSLIYLARKAQNKQSESPVNNTVMRAGYSYNCHAYMLSKKGMEEIITSPLLNNIVAIDEFYSGLHGTHDRQDIMDVFYNPKFKQYAFNDDYVGQTSSIKEGKSLTEFKPEDNKPEWLDDFKVEPKKEGTSFKSILPKPLKYDIDKPKKTLGILNDKNWDEWTKQYINPLLVNGEYDLITDEPAPHVYVFPLFTKAFCDELITLSEDFEWTTDRHKFYPTTDNLLSVLGMENIYNRVVNDYIRPYAIDRFQLDGKDWDYLIDESFIIKYPHDKQAHLSVHHDHSNITTLVNLNPGEFEGGGTYFPKYKCNINPKEIGVATLHPGNITHKHGARPVTKGTRYVVVSFIKGASHK
jgi:hypothetical protein